MTAGAFTPSGVLTDNRTSYDAFNDVRTVTAGVIVLF